MSYLGPTSNLGFVDGSYGAIEWAVVAGLFEFPCFLNCLFFYCYIFAAPGPTRSREACITLGGGLLSGLVLFALQFANNKMTIFDHHVVYHIVFVLGFGVSTAWPYLR